jgi:hypothetical protein
MKFKTAEKIMFEAQAPNAERIETILSTSDFFRATSTRRTLVQRILATGRGVAVGEAVGAAVLSRGMKSARAADDLSWTLATLPSVLSGLASHSTATHWARNRLFGVASDLAKGTLLDSVHRTYFAAARNQEDTHRSVLSRARFSVQRLQVPCRNIR